ncbi:hypothetical protein CY34DRAFT_494445 [Suillus luteus UH-Slu-Lm8-n1]|uniref:Uncharacterized protein n=1 Tax=Suillus luteus UH-Slu-Lm8-n1 TaxID=930992 RepID=A0A0D0BRS6_9AGAM|nr:hypothetical protein CY34DRAFT_494445 [Suillus luteus UH-Slu-Lm8-n1]
MAPTIGRNPIHKLLRQWSDFQSLRYLTWDPKCATNKRPPSIFLPGIIFLRRICFRFFISSYSHSSSSLLVVIDTWRLVDPSRIANSCLLVC